MEGVTARAIKVGGGHEEKAQKTEEDMREKHRKRQAACGLHPSTPPESTPAESPTAVLPRTIPASTTGGVGGCRAGGIAISGGPIAASRGATGVSGPGRRGSVVVFPPLRRAERGLRVAPPTSPPSLPAADACTTPVAMDPLPPGREAAAAYLFEVRRERPHGGAPPPRGQRE